MAYASHFLLMVPLILYGRKRLFSLINDLPTVFEVVTERKPVKDKPTADSGSKSRGSTKVSVFIFSFLICDICLCILWLGNQKLGGSYSKAMLGNACAF